MLITIYFYAIMVYVKQIFVWCKTIICFFFHIWYICTKKKEKKVTTLLRRRTSFCILSSKWTNFFTWFDFFWFCTKVPFRRHVKCRTRLNIFHRKKFLRKFSLRTLYFQLFPRGFLRNYVILSFLYISDGRIFFRNIQNSTDTYVNKKMMIFFNFKRVNF